MNTRMMTVRFVAGFLCGAGLLCLDAEAGDGLLVIAHGAPSPAWNKPVLDFGEHVAKKAAGQDSFSAVRTAMLEFAEPDVPGMVAELEAEGCERIVAVPLFIAPSGHSHFDVPAVLGIYSSPSTRETLAAEGATAARPKAPIVLTETLAEGTVLQEFACDQVRKLSTTPEDEALVVVAHGDADHHGLNEQYMRRVVAYCCGKTGIDYADWAYVAVGQTYAEDAVPVLLKAAKKKKRVLVVGLYISSSAATIHERAMRNAPKHVTEQFADKTLVFSKEGLVDFPGTVEWLLAAATAARAPASGEALAKAE